MKIRVLSPGHHKTKCDNAHLSPQYLRSRGRSVRYTARKNKNNNLWYYYYCLWLLNHKRELLITDFFSLELLMTNHLHSPPMQLLLVTCVSVVSSDTPVAVRFFQRKNQPRHSGVSPVLKRITGNSEVVPSKFLCFSAILPSPCPALPCQPPKAFQMMQTKVWASLRDFWK